MLPAITFSRFNPETWKRSLLSMRLIIGICPLTIGAMLLVAFGATPGRADVVSFVGDLRSDANFIDCGAGCTLGIPNSDGEYAQFAAMATTFHVSVGSAMQAITWSYGGGTNGNGAAIPEGGFQPYLSLFGASGAFLGSTYYGTVCPPGTHINSSSGQCYDVALDGGNLAPGDYSIAISAFANMSFAENLGVGTLADGFTGLGNLFPGEDLHYAFDVVLTAPTPTVPEPGSIGLLFAAVAAYGLKRGSRKASR